MMKFEFKFRKAVRLAWLLPFLINLLTHSAQAQNGRIERGQITSEALANLLGDSKTRPYQVYLPPSYGRGTQRYPVIYLLHGYLQDDNALVSSVQSSLNALIRQRRVGEMIAVFVNGLNRLQGSWYLSSPVIGDYESYITRDLVNLIDRHYRTLNSRESRGISGYSMGAWGAMHLALKFPASFSVVVAESGLYDPLTTRREGISRQFAASHPTNLAQFNRLSFPLNTVAALFAGLAPNLQRPALYSDYPYEWVNGQVVSVESVHQLAWAGDVQHGDVSRYAQQSIRLGGIKVVHGTADPEIPVGETRLFTNALARAGIPFEYQEHSGGHVYRPELALPFLSAHLKGAELYVTSPRLTATCSSNVLALSFPTARGVVYTVESRSPLSSADGVWTERICLNGNGQAATWSCPMDANIQFLRVRAANMP